MKNWMSGMVVGVLLAVATAGLADVLKMGGTRNTDGTWNGLASLETVPVGNAGNTADTRYATPGYGRVDYTYNIGKYEVTAGQYTEFLNNKAKYAGDPNGLYNTAMGYLSANGCNIQYSGAGTVDNPYTYSVAPDWANRPVNYVSYWDACRFANWLCNGQGDGSTETGAYTLTADGTYNNTITRNTNWKWAVTSEDEWYKAAYYMGDGTNTGYFDYPTSSDNVPSNVLVNPGDPGNNATFETDNTPFFTIGSPYYRTEVGAHENSDSPYGTFDQGGNVREWNDASGKAVIGRGRGVRGGAVATYEFLMQASYRDLCNPTGESWDLGFRVSEVPEPLSMAFLALGGLGMLIRRRGSSLH